MLSSVACSMDCCLSEDPSASHHHHHQVPQRSHPLTRHASLELVSDLKKEFDSPLPRTALGGVSYQHECKEGSVVQHQHRKRVRFEPEGVHIRTTLGRHELSDEELAAGWYHKEEFRQIARGSRELARQWSRGKSIECSRGLEWLTRDGRTQTREMRQSALEVVLNEQDKQMTNGTLDLDYIALVYRLATSKCLCWSIKVGLEDQRESKRSQYDDNRDLSSCSTERERMEPEYPKVKALLVSASKQEQEESSLTSTEKNLSLQGSSITTFDGARAA